ncbi:MULTISPECIES: hypothetical protein [Microbacterium]|uniref:Uncharacterized protein n=1 Tax=Microbacterium trichothecenolyticum TaxID=69370 RepID=A0A0M2H8G1_MICTR|nr:MULTISPECIES: hypothetical protein [Microbacterium]KJL40856.1 hypothetical protein RS82_03472 [Microbacterium trichothecenolyticum]MDR7188741.1 hypothetical protein [Microbacterium sp. BE35]
MADRADWDDADGITVDAGPAFAPGPEDAVADWAPTDVMVDDDPFANAFTDEIANVTASDWDVDADVLWGDDASPDLGIDPGASAFDFPA